MAMKFTKERMYHLPHNAVVPEEFDFMLRCLDVSKEFYTAEELRKLFLIEEVKAGVFSKFHKAQYKNFKDKAHISNLNLEKKIRTNLTLNRNFCTAELKEIANNEGPKAATEYLINRKLTTFEKFEREPEKYIDEILQCEYTASKTWQGNWAESVRDYIQFFAYAGLLPCYYKGMNTSLMDSGFYITQRLKKYLEKEISLKDIILEYKYKNALIDIRRYPMYNINVRPYYAALSVLKIFKDDYGISVIDKTLLSAIVSCINHEGEIEEVVQEVYHMMQDKRSPMSAITKDVSFIKEADRFGLTLKPYLEECDLIITQQINRKTFIGISVKGEAALLNAPRRTAYCYELIGPYALTPVMGYLFNLFQSITKLGVNRIDLKEIESDYIKEIMQDKLKHEEFMTILSDMMSMESINVINSIDGSLLHLNPITEQFSINSGADFLNVDDSNFVEMGSSIPEDKNIRKYFEVNEELELRLTELKTISTQSDGEKYEDSLSELMKDLIGDKYIFQLGNIGARAQRLSDIVWKVPIRVNNRDKNLLVVLEAKAGNAIKGFDERKEQDDLIRTIEKFRNEIDEIEGVWYWVINGQSLPRQRHGGFRGNGVAFEDKLTIIQMNIMSIVHRPVVVSAMSCEVFIEYYRYLYKSTRGFEEKFRRINSFYVDEFWTWGKLFRPLGSYVKILNDPEEIKKYLI